MAEWFWLSVEMLINFQCNQQAVWGKMKTDATPLVSKVAKIHPSLEPAKITKPQGEYPPLSFLKKYPLELIKYC